MPKPKHSVWRYFECIIKKKNSTGKWAKCRECSKEMQGIPSRMEKHILSHQKNTSSDTTDTPSADETTQHSVTKYDLPSTSNSTSKKRVNTTGNC